MNAERRRILVVDDDADVRQIVADTVAILGHDVATAADGSAALERLREEALDAMIVDFAMPGMNGAEVARQARLLRADLPIIVASGAPDTDAIGAVGRGPALLVLRKPFRIAELEKAVQAALESAREAERPPGSRPVRPLGD